MSGNSTAQGGAPSKTPPRAANGWDGKLRINQEEDDDEDDNNDEQSDAEEDTGAEGFPSTEIDGAEIDADEGELCLRMRMMSALSDKRSNRPSGRDTRGRDSELAYYNGTDQRGD